VGYGVEIGVELVEIDLDPGGERQETSTGRAERGR
jgi:hypothetical protein